MCKKKAEAAARAENPNLFHSIAMEAFLLPPLPPPAPLFAPGLPLLLHFHFSVICKNETIFERNF